MPLRLWFLIGILALVGTVLAVGLAWQLLLREIRRFSWSHEQARRAGLQRIVVEIVQSRRVTEDIRQYTVRVVPLAAKPGLTPPTPLTLRFTPFLSQQARKHARKTKTFPALYDVSAPQRLILDLAALDLSEEARKYYVDNGNPEWTMI